MLSFISFSSSLDIPKNNTKIAHVFKCAAHKETPTKAPLKCLISKIFAWMRKISGAWEWGMAFDALSCDSSRSIGRMFECIAVRVKIAQVLHDFSPSPHFSHSYLLSHDAHIYAVTIQSSCSAWFHRHFPKANKRITIAAARREKIISQDLLLHNC